MAEALGGWPVRFTRLAVTAAQAEAMGLPSAPPKASDRRSFSAARDGAGRGDPAGRTERSGGAGHRRPHVPGDPGRGQGEGT